MTRAAARSIALGAVLAGAIGLLAPGQARAEDAAPQGQPQPPQAAPPAPPQHRLPRLSTLRDVGLALEICWEANEPPLAQARPGMNVTVMLTFTRSGQILGEPRFTYMTPEATAETKALYQRAVVAAIDACTPLPISPALGNALAGSPKVMPFIDRRNQKGT